MGNKAETVLLWTKLTHTDYASVNENGGKELSGGHFRLVFMEAIDFSVMFIYGVCSWPRTDFDPICEHIITLNIHGSMQLYVCVRIPWDSILKSTRIDRTWFWMQIPSSTSHRPAMKRAMKYPFLGRDPNCHYRQPTFVLEVPPISSHWTRTCLRWVNLYPLSA